MYTRRSLQAYWSVSTRAEKSLFYFMNDHNNIYFKRFVKKVSGTIRYELGCSFSRTTGFWLLGQNFHPLSDPYRLHTKIARSVCTHETIKRITERIFIDSKIMLDISRSFKIRQQ